MYRLLAVVSVFMLTGCITHPKFDTNKFERPHSLAIVKPPPSYYAALISEDVFMPGLHFTPKGDYFFDVKGGANQNGAVMAVPYMGGGLAGALFESHSANTQNRAQEFHANVLKQNPGMNLAGEFTEALRTSFAARGIQTVIVTDSADVVPRLRWSAPELNPLEFPVAAIDRPAVDADLLLQVSPVVIYNAPGPLNNYRVEASVGVVLYNGRTKQYLGMERFRFNPKAWHNEFATYGGVAGSLTTAVPAMREGLLSLAPTVADVVSKQASKQSP